MFSTAVVAPASVLKYSQNYDGGISTIKETVVIPKEDIEITNPDYTSNVIIYGW